MTLQYRVGDVFDRLAEIPDDSIDLIVTSPPFLALRSYLPADHPDKHKEIGSEPTPAEFIDTLLALSAEWGRVLAPHGSMCVELGDTYAGSGGNSDTNSCRSASNLIGNATRNNNKVGPSWPLAKSLTGIPTLYPWSLAYGRNLLTGDDSPAGQWRIRNVIVWARPNPPVGALGDKFRPATSYITVACQGPKRYFDLDAVRTEHVTADAISRPRANYRRSDDDAGESTNTGGNPAGAPPLDWHTDDLDGDWLWKLPTQPYKGSHYATFPLTLPKRLIEAMCPPKVCTVCGKPSERITERTPEYNTGWSDCGCPDYVAQPNADTPLPYAWISPTGYPWVFTEHGSQQINPRHVTPLVYNDREKAPGSSYRQGVSSTATAGSTPGAFSRWRTGIVLDPFAGSGTTLEAAQAVGRHAIGIDLDDRNADLAQERVGMFMDVDRV